MKKSIYGLLAAAMLTTSCQKDLDYNPEPETQSSSFVSSAEAKARGLVEDRDGIINFYLATYNWGHEEVTDSCSVHYNGNYNVHPIEGEDTPKDLMAHVGDSSYPGIDFVSIKDDYKLDQVEKTQWPYKNDTIFLKFHNLSTKYYKVYVNSWGMKSRMCYLVDLYSEWGYPVVIPIRPVPYWSNSTTAYEFKYRDDLTEYQKTHRISILATNYYKE